MSDYIIQKIQGMTLREKVGQLFIVGLNTTYVDMEFINILKEYPFGGVGLFERNIESPVQVRELTEQIQKLAVKLKLPWPYTIAIDQEGGVLSLFTKGITGLPGNMAIGATGSEVYAYNAAYITACELNEMGINIDWAPVLDLSNNHNNPVIGVRSFGDDPEMVSKLGKSFIEGIHHGGVASTIKHFPGHGNTEVDSHYSLPTSSAGLYDLMNYEIIPFKEGMEKNPDAVMIAHMLYPMIGALDVIPSSLSKYVITDILRGKLGFNGVVMTDDMGMQAIKDNYSMGEAAVRSILAGVDNIVMCHDREGQIEAFNAVYKAVEDGIIPLKMIDDSVERILKMRNKFILYGKEKKSIFAKEKFGDKAGEISADSITLVSDGNGLIPLKKELYDRVLVINPIQENLSPADSSGASECGLGEIIKTEFHNTEVRDIPLRAEERYIQEIIKEVEKYDLVIQGTINSNQFPLHLELINRIVQLKIPLVLISMRYPAEVKYFPREAGVIAAYTTQRVGVAAAVDVLMGRKEARGKIPVNI